MGKRPRINIDNKMAGAVAVIDNLEFKKNRGSDNARFIEDVAVNLSVELWHEKHYVIRHQHGDDNGKREGIEPDVIKELIADGLKHLFYYSSTVRDFAFINPEKRGVFRIVVQDSYSQSTILNVVIEIHFIDFFKYEITVVTAMSDNAFKIGDGQYVLTMRGEDDSILRRLVRGKFDDISSCQT